jgi:hypothetical protein
MRIRRSGDITGITWSVPGVDLGQSIMCPRRSLRMILKEMSEKVDRIDKLMTIFLTQKMIEHTEKKKYKLINPSPSGNPLRPENVDNIHCECLFCVETRKILEINDAPSQQS